MPALLPEVRIGKAPAVIECGVQVAGVIRIPVRLHGTTPPAVSDLNSRGAAFKDVERHHPVGVFTESLEAIEEPVFDGTPD